MVDPSRSIRPLDDGSVAIGRSSVAVVESGRSALKAEPAPDNGDRQSPGPHGGNGDDIKNPEVLTENEIIDGIKRPGKFDATVASEAQARQLVQAALPHATELPPAVAGQPYPSPPKGFKAWF